MSTNHSKYALDMSQHRAVIAELWKEILHLPDLPAETDNFFALGGDSMSMVMLQVRVKEELGIDVADDAVLGAQTLHEFSTIVDEARTHRRPGSSPSEGAAVSG